MRSWKKILLITVLVILAIIISTYLGFYIYVKKVGFPDSGFNSGDTTLQEGESLCLVKEKIDGNEVPASASCDGLIIILEKDITEQEKNSLMSYLNQNASKVTDRLFNDEMWIIEFEPKTSNELTEWKELIEIQTGVKSVGYNKTKGLH